MKAAYLKRIVPLLGLSLFVLAAVALYRQLHAYRLNDILVRIHEMPSSQLWMASMLTACSYLIMTGYDFLALHYIRHPMKMAKTALASFLGYTFSNNIGFSMIAGASVRYRLYSA